MFKRNHRVVGKVVAESDGFTVLQTAEHAYTAARTGELLPVNDKELVFDLRMLLAEAIERARFLGVPDDALHALLDAELRASVPT